jgi:hypothetical protein
VWPGGTSKQRLWLGTSQYRDGCRNTAANADSDSKWYANTFTDSLRGGNTNTDGDCYAYRHTYCYTYSYAYSNPSTKPDAYTYGHAYSDGNSYAKSDTKAPADSPWAPDSALSGVIRLRQSYGGQVGEK